MSRSVWKSKFVEPGLLKLIFVNKSFIKKSSKKKTFFGKIPLVWSRRSTIIPAMIGMKFRVHVGNRFVTIAVLDSMIGHKFGEYAFTKKMGSKIHSRKVGGETSDKKSFIDRIDKKK